MLRLTMPKVIPAQKEVFAFYILCDVSLHVNSEINEMSYNDSTRLKAGPK